MDLISKSAKSQSPVTKRKRGRPRKYHTNLKTGSTPVVNHPSSDTTKRKPGRPRGSTKQKNPVSVSATKPATENSSTASNAIVPQPIQAPIAVAVGWPPLKPILPANIPSFPSDALPRVLADFVEASAETTGAPVDLTAMPCLSALSTALAKKFKVQVDPHDTSYRVGLNLYTSAVCESGNCKSASFKNATRPLFKYINANSQRLVAGNVTARKLEVLLQDNGGRIAFLTEEGRTILDLIRDTKTLNSPLDAFLKGHDGEDIWLDRIDRSCHIPNVTISMGLSVQPGVVENLRNNRDAVSSGLINRFLFAFPPSRLGVGELPTHDQSGIPNDIKSAYAVLMTTLLSLPLPTSEEILLLSDEARSTHREFEAWIWKQLDPSGPLASICEWGSKLRSQVVRIAGILHVVENVMINREIPKMVEASTMKDAIRIGHYLIPHAMKAFGVSGVDLKVQYANKVLRKIREWDEPQVSQKRLWDVAKGTIKSIEDLERTLRQLVEKGYLRKVERTQNATAGRPSIVFDVNPEILTAPENPQNPL